MLILNLVWSHRIIWIMNIYNFYFRQIIFPQKTWLNFIGFIIVELTCMCSGQWRGRRCFILSTFCLQLLNGFQKSLKPGISSCSFRCYNFRHNFFEVVRIKCYEFQKQYRLIRRNSNVLLHSLLHSFLLYFITLLTRSHIAFWLLFLTPVRHRGILDHCHGRDRSTYSMSLIAFEDSMLGPKIIGRLESRFES